MPNLRLYRRFGRLTSTTSTPLARRKQASPTAKLPLPLIPTYSGASNCSAQTTTTAWPASVDGALLWTRRLPRPSRATATRALAWGCTRSGRQAPLHPLSVDDEQVHRFLLLLEKLASRTPVERRRTRLRTDLRCTGSDKVTILAIFFLPYPMRPKSPETMASLTFSPATLCRHSCLSARVAAGRSWKSVSRARRPSVVCPGSSSVAAIPLPRYLDAAPD